LFIFLSSLLLRLGHFVVCDLRTILRSLRTIVHRLVLNGFRILGIHRLTRDWSGSAQNRLLVILVCAFLFRSILGVHVISLMTSVAYLLHHLLDGNVLLARCLSLICSVLLLDDRYAIRRIDGCHLVINSFLFLLVAIICIHVQIALGRVRGVHLHGCASCCRCNDRSFHCWCCFCLFLCSLNVIAGDDFNFLHFFSLAVFFRRL